MRRLTDLTKGLTMVLGRLWNLRTKLVTVLGLVLAGTFLLQGILHQQTRQQLLDEVAGVAQEILEETVARINGAQHRSREPFMISHRGSRTIIMIPPRTLKALDSRRRLVASDAVELNRVAAQQEAIRRQIQLVVTRTMLQHRPGISVPQGLGVPAFSSPSGDPDDLGPILDVERLNPGKDLSSKPFELIGELPPGSEENDKFGATPRGESIDITPYLGRVEELFKEAKFKESLATFGIFLVGFAVAWLLGARLIRPVLQVADGLQQVAAGDLEAQVEVPGDPELAVIADQFNEMVTRLREGKAIERELEKRERIQHMGDLAAGVAHDVRNPLNSIRLALGQVREEFVPENPEKRERFLRFTGDAEAEVARLKQLVSDFLALAQPSSTELEQVAPKVLVEELLRLLANEAADKGVELEMEIEEDLPDLLCNRLELKSAFLNVSINALQAFGAAGGELRVEAERCDRGVELRFIDDGPGIAAEHLDRVFVPYFTRREGGTGLGLSIVKRIAERNGGKVDIDSVEGEGTVVRFQFPVRDLETGEVS